MGSHKLIRPRPFRRPLRRILSDIVRRIISRPFPGKALQESVGFQLDLHKHGKVPTTNEMKSLAEYFLTFLDDLTNSNLKHKVALHICELISAEMEKRPKDTDYLSIRAYIRRLNELGWHEEARLLEKQMREVDVSPETGEYTPPHERMEKKRE